MKRFVWMIILCIVGTARAYFSVSGPASWYETKMNQFACDVNMRGILFEADYTFQLEPIPRGNNLSMGSTKVTWSFNSTSDAVVTGCWMKPSGASEFVEADIENITDAESRFYQYPSSRPKLLLRQRTEIDWQGVTSTRYEMTVEPVPLNSPPVIRIRILAPSMAYYQARRLWLYLNDFYVDYPCDLKLSHWDSDNPSLRPAILDGYSSPPEWRRSSRWSIQLHYYRNDVNYNTRYYGNLLLACSPESADRSLLRVWDEPGGRFYQLSLTPPIHPEDRKPKNILLAVDLTADYGYRSQVIQNFRQAVGLSVNHLDSIALIQSSFMPRLADSLFAPAAEGRLNTLFQQYDSEPPPRISALPHLLRQAIEFLNRSGRNGEIWLVSDATQHGSPASAVMDIINQTLRQADHAVVFRIINAGNGGSGLQIGNQYYQGNDYLYENLARLSHGSHILLRNFQTYTYLDAMLDCVAPTLAASEFDPEPAGGISYSRYPLNRGRSDFPVTQPYYEIGLYDGSMPWSVHCFGSLDGELFAEDALLSTSPSDSSWSATRNYWYALYVRDLLLEPQSHRTIAYIETVSVANRLLTPYTGFIIPGLDGLLAFQRLGIQSGVSTVTEEKKETGIGVFPNPFNAEATIRIRLSESRTREADVWIFNILGQKIRSWTVETNPASETELRWDGADQNGLAAPSGIYVVVLRAAGLTRSVKISLQR